MCRAIQLLAAASVSVLALANAFGMTRQRVEQIIAASEGWQVWTPERQADEFSEVRGDGP